MFALVAAGLLAFSAWPTASAQNALRCYHCSEADSWCYGVSHASVENANESLDMNKAWWLNWVGDLRCAQEYSWCVTEYANFRFENEHGKLVSYNRACHKNMDNVPDNSCADSANGTRRCFCKTAYCNAHPIEFSKAPHPSEKAKADKEFLKIAYGEATSEKFKMDFKNEQGSMALQLKGPPTVIRLKDENFNNITKRRSVDVEAAASVTCAVKCHICTFNLPNPYPAEAAIMNACWADIQSGLGKQPNCLTTDLSKLDPFLQECGGRATWLPKSQPFKTSSPATPRSSSLTPLAPGASCTEGKSRKRLPGSVLKRHVLNSQSKTEPNKTGYSVDGYNSYRVVAFNGGAQSVPMFCATAGLPALPTNSSSPLRPSSQGGNAAGQLNGNSAVSPSVSTTPSTAPKMAFIHRATLLPPTQCEAIT
ncbi:hypothetical protein RvY_16967 [Ramazzottius varieornatus]|uniref:Secreted protein n=1 Tax=Ramazzottius varieornatus TaxID=947166 RepID=A0A1D1W4L1_RAMVA|nr:hypothetical protein RvY_16967 [Ramazzottius varieornatus]